MQMNTMPAAERTRIGFFGCRNAGKSSLVNAVTDQELSVVSPQRGTTTDPVLKTMELLPLGPVVIIDTPGYDDEGELGSLRVEKTRNILRSTDIAVLVVDSTEGFREADRELLRLFEQKKTPFLVALNKCDLQAFSDRVPENAVPVSAVTGNGVNQLKERIAALLSRPEAEKQLAADLVQAGDCVILVCPIDEAAPKGRLILPQQQVIRDLMEKGALPLVVRETELAQAMDCLRDAPTLVITDSQVFRVVADILSEEVPLTSFSILLARYKGFLQTAVRGVAAIRHLPDGARILMAEGCTHHRQCSDIGTVKIPRGLSRYTGREFDYETCSGMDFPADLSSYDLVIYCGGCMTPEKEVLARMEMASGQKVPFTNYGITLAEISGTLERSLRLFPEIHAMLKGGRT